MVDRRAPVSRSEAGKISSLRRRLKLVAGRARSPDQDSKAEDSPATAPQHPVGPTDFCSNGKLIMIVRTRKLAVEILFDCQWAGAQKRTRPAQRLAWPGGKSGLTTGCAPHRCKAIIEVQICRAALS